MQRTAARCSCRRWRNKSSVGDMQDELEWPSLEARREQSSLTLFSKIHPVTVCLKKDKYLTPAPNLRRTRACHDGSGTPRPKTISAWDSSARTFRPIFQSGTVQPTLVGLLGPCFYFYLSFLGVGWGWGQFIVLFGLCASKQDSRNFI